MKTKSLLLMIFLFSVLWINCYATDSSITVDCSDYTYANLGVSTYAVDGLYEDNVVCITAEKPSTYYEIRYSIEAPKAGGYKMNIVSTSLHSQWTSCYTVEINGKTTMYPESDAEAIQTLSQTVHSAEMIEYSLGTVYLYEGDNTVSIILETPRKTDSNVIAYLDCFELIPQEFAFDKIEPTQELGIFTEFEMIEFDIKFKTLAEEAKNYQYVVKDYHGVNVFGENITLSEGSCSIRINPQITDYGWYKLIIYDGMEILGETGFSVIHETDGSDAPFAIDFASYWIVDNTRDIKRIGSAAKKAGISNIRERYRWNEIESTDDSYNFSVTDSNINAVDEIGFSKLAMFSDTPSWAVGTGYLSQDLFSIYDFQKKFAERYGGSIQAMEVWNEEDTSFAAETADEFAAFYKAAAIGIADGSTEIQKCFGGFAKSPASSDFMDILMQNDVMDYSDIYNYHSYSSEGEKGISQNVDGIKAHRDLLITHGNSDAERWVTEGGVVAGNDEAELQAKAVITTYCQSFAYGVDKHFWFMLPYFVENINQFGIFNEDKTPRPAYNALSVLTNMLGKAKYIGEFYNMPVGVTGYLFNNGTNDIGVFWSEQDTYVQFSEEDQIELTTMMGTKRQILPIVGEINIPVNAEPIFVEFNTKCNAENVYMDSTNSQHDIGTAKRFTDTQRIVLKQNFYGKNYKNPKKNGYSIYVGEDNTCTVEIYNFSNVEQTGMVYAVVTEGFSLRNSSYSVSIPANSTVTVDFIINADVEESGILKFYGVFGGEETSCSVSKISGVKEVYIENYSVFSNSKTASGWYTNGVSSGNCTASTVSGAGVNFQVNMGAGWCYPVVELTFLERYSIRNSDGLVYWIYSEVDIPQTLQHIFVHTSDGRKFYEGEDGQEIKAGWNQISVLWEDLQLQYLPENLDIENPEIFDITKVTHLSVGLNSQNSEYKSYNIKDFGYYTAEETQTTEIVVNTDIIYNIEDRNVVNAGDLIEGTVSNIGEEDEVTVYLSGKTVYSTKDAEFDTISINGFSGNVSVSTYTDRVLRGNVQLYDRVPRQNIIALCTDADNNIKFISSMYTDQNGRAEFSFINDSEHDNLSVIVNFPEEEKVSGNIDFISVAENNISVARERTTAKILFDTQDMDKGMYSLLVVVRKKTGEFIRKSVDFCVDNRF